MVAGSFICTNPDDCGYKDGDTGNCIIRGIDGGIVQCVNEWSKRKHYYLLYYLETSRKARKKYADRGNAVYIDLYSGPGRARIKSTKEEIEGGCVQVLSTEHPFNTTILNDLLEDNVNALKNRVPEHVTVYNKNANSFVKDLVPELNRDYYKYHFAYVDPFAPGQLHFDTIKSLAQLQHVDIMINFPIGAIRRNYDRWMDVKKDEESTILDRFMGTTEWRERVRSSSGSIFTNTMLDIYSEQLLSIGFPPEGLNLADEEGDTYHGTSHAIVKNSLGVPQYFLVLATKHREAARLWRETLKYDPSGQKGLFN